MFYGLYMIVSAAFAAIWAFCWSLGGQLTRMVITGGLYRFHAGYRPHKGLPRLVRGHADHRARTIVPDDLADLFMRPAAPEPPPVSAPSLLVHAELDAAHTGAENWDDLLTAMTTEEREIYNLEMYQTHEAAMEIQREIYARSDDWFGQLMDAWEAGTEAVTCGARGWDTGMWQVYDAEQTRPPAEVLV